MNIMMAGQRNSRFQLAQQKLFDIVIFLFNVVTNGADGFVDPGIARGFQFALPAGKSIGLLTKRINKRFQR